MSKHTVILAGTRYMAQVIDNQVVFTSSEAGVGQNFTFDRPPIKDKPGMWQLYDINLDYNTIPVCHIMHALTWVNATFGADFMPYKGGIKYFTTNKKKSISRPNTGLKFGSSGCGDY